MNFYKLFYWLTVGDKLSSFFCAMAILFTILFLVILILRLTSVSQKNRDQGVEGTKYIKGEDGKQYEVFQDWYFNFRKWTWTILMLCLGFWLLYVSTPDKKEAVLIIGGGYVMNFVTQDSAMKQLPSDIVYFIRSNLQLAAKEAQVEIRDLTNRQTLADSLGKMTRAELENYILKK